MRPASVNEWEPPDDRRPSSLARAALGAGYGLLWVGGLFLATRAPIVGGTVVALLGVWLAARALAARGRPGDDRDARVMNLVRGLAADVGVPVPRLRILEGADANARVYSWFGRDTVLLTQGLLTSYSRTELEAVIAHCLVRLKAGGLQWHELVGMFGGLGASAAPFVGEGLDARTAAITRYPPALASAIEKAVPKRGAGAGLWFVATGPTHLPPAERVAALLDL